MEMCRLSGAALEFLSEEDKLNLVVDGQHTSTSNTTKDVSTSTLEERTNTFSSNNLGESIDGRLVLDGLERIISKSSWLVDLE
jgi:hypothetical protein